MAFLCRCVVVVAAMCAGVSPLLANGGAWQTGVPSTGNAAASDKQRTTDVTIAEEHLTVDLHYEFATVEVRYRMQNTGDKKLQQEFFFPVERWTAPDHEEAEKPADLEGYRITADGAELKWKNVPSPEKGNVAADENWGEFPPSAKLWKKSEIPFAPGQTREVVIRYRAGYNGASAGVSDDLRQSDQLFLYALSPAATWKGPIGRGHVVVNVLHPLPDEVEIQRPQNRFQKVSDTRYEWTFTDLEPTLDDDIKIVARRGREEYSRGFVGGEDDQQPILDYVIRGDRYFLQHNDFKATASSTLKPIGKRKYDIENVRAMNAETAWCEGAPDDGIGESITLDVKRPLPLAAIMIAPGYYNFDNKTLWAKNNRVAEMEVTLNGTHTFTAKIPDEQFTELYPLLVRDFNEPVREVKLTIRAVHRGTAARDTCISTIRLQAKLDKKPEFEPAR
jgi:hypothetical protein